MNTYTALYLFVKLDDIRGWFENSYGFFTIGLFITIVATVFICCHFSFDYSKEEAAPKWEIFFKWLKIDIVVLTLIFLIQFSFNVIATVLPSTGQMAAIYIGGAAANSSTVSILKQLPEKYATLLNSKADEWVAAQLPKIKEVTE